MSATPQPPGDEPVGPIDQPFQAVEQHFAPAGHLAPLRWGRLLAWLGGLLAVHLALSAWYTSSVNAKHRVILADDAFLADPEPVRLLVLGDSHPRNAVDDALLPGALNLANGGESYVKTYYRLRYLLERSDRRVGAILLPMEPQAFDSWHADYYQPEYVYGRYVPFLELGWRRGRPVEYANWWVKAHLAPYTGESQTIGEMLRGKRDFHDEMGIARFSSARPVEQWALGQERAEWHFEGHEYRDALQIWAFEQTLALCDAEGIRPILVSYPVSQEYWYFAEKLGPVAAMRAVLDPLLARRPDLVHLDYHAAFFGRNDLFHDPDHVNRGGRQRFTRMLNDDLVALGVVPETSVIPPRRQRPRGGLPPIDPPPQAPARPLDRPRDVGPDVFPAKPDVPDRLEISP